MEDRKGYAVGGDRYVVLDEEDLETIQPEPSRDIELTRFVEPATLGHAWYDRPYFLGPDGEPESYAALVEALADEGREGIARRVMRNRPHLGALRREGDAPAPEGRELEEPELEMAGRLVEATSGFFDPTEYEDRHRLAVLELIEKKAKGGAVDVAPPEQKAPSEEDELAAALEESLRAVGERAA